MCRNSKEAFETYYGEEDVARFQGIQNGRISIRITGLMVFAEPTGLWIRPYSDQEKGPILRWEPHRAMMRNMVSDEFAVWVNMPTAT